MPARQIFAFGGLVVCMCLPLNVKNPRSVSCAGLWVGVGCFYSSQRIASEAHTKTIPAMVQMNEVRLSFTDWRNMSRRGKLNEAPIWLQAIVQQTKPVMATR